MKIGIIQGRLSAPINNCIQEFPFNSWEKEFFLIKFHKLNHIEWVITENFRNSDLFHNIKLSNYYKKISSLCADTIVSDRFHEADWVFNEMKNIILFGRKNNIYNITVPLLEKSSIKKRQTRRDILKIFNKLITENNDINFSFETDLKDSSCLINFIKNNKKFFITYDTGNMTSENVNHERYLLNIINYINNIHLKDKNSLNQTVLPGRGITNFDLILKTLKKSKYNGLFTMQFARNKTGEESNAVASYKQFIINKWNNIQ